MTKHSTLVGGSTADRFINCMGWNVLAAKLPKQPPGKEATRGSALHEAMEFLLDKPTDYDPYGMAESVITIKGEGDVTITDELIANKIEPCIVWFNDVMGDAEFYVEQKVRWAGELKDAWGPADILYRLGDVAGVIDWKFGDNVHVDADESMQLPFYLGAAIDTFPEFFEGVKEYRCYIVQPTELGVVQYREDGDYSHFVQDTVVTQEDIDNLREDLLYGKEQREAGNTDTEPGSWCKFCPAMPICPSYRERGVSALQTDTKVLRKEGTHDEITAAYLEALEVSKWADSVKKLVKDLFAMGKPVAGLKRVQHATRRDWADQKYAEGVLRRNFKLKKDDMFESNMKSPAKIEKLIGKKLDVGRKPLVVSFPYSFAIVSEDDPREAVVDESDANAAADALKASLGQ